MEIRLKGDKEFENIPSLKDKALRINLNENIYGTFAEIGAGQETVRHFFRAGGASGTIAKAMSAYDKDFSDAIYGIENDRRYVTEARLRKMVSHEIKLIEERIDREKNPHKMFFSFANTVATIDLQKSIKDMVGLVLNTKLILKKKNIMKLYYTYVLKKTMQDYNKKHLVY